MINFNMPLDSFKQETSHVSIKKIRPAYTSEWASIWQECKYSTYFQSVEWAEIWHQYTNGKIHLSPLFVLFSDGNKAIIPFTYKKMFKGLTKLFLLSPEGTYGGWLSADNLDNRHATLLVNLIRQKFRNLIWRLNPYDENIFKTGIPVSCYDETNVIKLTSDFDSIFANMSKHTRQSIKKASEYGITTRVASEIEDWESYYRAYEDNLVRWGDKLLGEKYQWSFFKQLSQRNSTNIRLWLGIFDKKIVGGVLCFASKRHIVEWHNSVLNAYYKVGVVDLLICEIIKDSLKKGYTWFDFNPSGGLEGVKRHKKSFGSQPLSCPYMLSTSSSSFALEKIGSIVSRLGKMANKAV